MTKAKKTIKPKCWSCKAECEAEDLCADEYCRDCHVSCSFEDCVSGAWVDERRAKAGLYKIDRTK